MSEQVARVDEMLRAAAEAGTGYDRAALLHDLAQLSLSEAAGSLRRLAREKKEMAVPLLAGLATSAGGPLAVAAVEALGTIRDVAAASSLQLLVSSGELGADLRKAARRALHRLASLGVHPSVAAPAVEDERRGGWLLQVALASPIDGGGNRAMWLGFPRGPEMAMVGLVLNDEKGIVDFFSTEMARSRFERETVRLLREEAEPWVEMPADYVRHLIEEAHARNAASATPLPLEYLTWRDRIGRPQQWYDQPIVYRVINSAEVRWDPRYLDRSPELFDLEMFQMWVLDREELAEFVRERVMAQQTGLVLAGVSPEAQDRMMVDKAIQRLFDLRRRSLYKRRLEEMAYQLWKLERVERARMALAAALALEPPDRPLQDHPFIRTMVEWSLEVVTAMVQGERAKAVRPGVQIHLPY